MAGPFRSGPTHVLDSRLEINAVETEVWGQRDRCGAISNDSPGQAANAILTGQELVTSCGAGPISLCDPMKPVIKVENISKQYHLSDYQEAYQTLRDVLVSTIKSPLARFNKRRNSNRNSVWALKDVSIEVKAGETVGIIGRSGAGKSTLLKVLSHRTEPTTGRAELYGRVGSLLEVGPGFHPELSG